MHLHVEFSCDLHLVVQQDRSGADAVLSCNYDDNVIIFVTFVSGYTWQHLHAPDHITCCLLTVSYSNTVPQMSYHRSHNSIRTRHWCTRANTSIQCSYILPGVDADMMLTVDTCTPIMGVYWNGGGTPSFSIFNTLGEGCIWKLSVGSYLPAEDLKSDP